MQTPFFDTLKMPAPVSYESLQELGSLQVRVVRKLAALQIDFATLGMQGTLEQAQTIGKVNSIGDLLSAQSRLASSMGDRLMEITREAGDLLTESHEEFIGWVKQSMVPATVTAAKPASPKAGKTKKTAAKASARRGNRKKAA